MLKSSLLRPSLSEMASQYFISLMGHLLSDIIVSNITNRVADKEYIIITFEVVGVLTQGEKCIHDNPETNIGVSHNKGKNWTFLALTDDVPNILRMRFDEEIINKIMNY